MLATVRTVTKRVTRNRRTMVTVNVGDGSGRMEVVFFNQPWRERQLREGLQIALFGKADVYRGGLQMSNPIVDLIGDRTGRIVPIYPQSEKAQINTWEVAGWVEEALRRCRERGIDDTLPDPIRRRLGLLERFEAFANIHLPESIAEKEQARRRLAFDELLRVQLVLVLRKRAMERDQRGLVHRVDGDLVRRFYAALPYPLTAAQQRAIGEIEADLAAPHPMHRLLQGDVGSGKTVVAVATMLAAVQGGHQAALMAPTEVLADQHASGVRALLDGVSVPDPGNLFGDRPLRVELLTNRVTGSDRRDVLGGLADGTVDIVIGTHALIQDAVDFASLGAVVVDEQHRFGVEQRAALRAKTVGGAVPDMLVMTATPIPRTAAMTVYGDLDVSVLDELPPGRTPIVTRWAQGPLLEAEVWAEVRAAVGEGRQVYVVCPLIGESEKLEVASAEETFERLANDELAGLRLGLLHGRLSSAEKEATMECVPVGGPRRAGGHHGDRGRCRRPERDRDGDPRRRPVRDRPAPSASRAGRTGRARVDVLARDPAARAGRRRRQPAGRGAGRHDRRFRAGGDRPGAARGGHLDVHLAEGPQRPQARLAPPGPQAGRVGAGGGVRDRRCRPRTRAVMPASPTNSP